MTKHLMLSLSLLFAWHWAIGPPSASAQSLPIHNAPQGVASYASPADWIPVSGQCHWVPGDGSPMVMPPDTLTMDMAHTHAEVVAPIWAELGAGPITIPLTLQLFHTAGAIGIVEIIYNGPNGQQGADVVMDEPGPYVGDPNGLVKYTGHFVFDPASPAAVYAGYPQHGWMSIMLFTRTGYLNGDVLDNETVIPFYSVMDVSQPEVTSAENAIPITAKCAAASHGQNESDLFGEHLVEIRDQQIPLLAPFAAPVIEHVFGYSYGFDHNIPAADFSYAALYDNDFHNGIPGSVLTSTEDGNIGNYDILDPLVLAGSPSPAGFAPGQHRITVFWDATIAHDFLNQLGTTTPGGLELRALLSFKMRVGPNPVGCTPATCPAGVPPPTPPPPPPPPPPPVTSWVTTGTDGFLLEQSLENANGSLVLPAQFQLCLAQTPNQCVPWVNHP